MLACLIYGCLVLYQPPAGMSGPSALPNELVGVFGVALSLLALFTTAALWTHLRHQKAELDQLAQWSQARAQMRKSSAQVRKRHRSLY